MGCGSSSSAGPEAVASTMVTAAESSSYKNSGTLTNPASPMIPLQLPGRLSGAEAPAPVRSSEAQEANARANANAEAEAEAEAKAKANAKKGKAAVHVPGFGSASEIVAPGSAASAVKRAVARAVAAAEARLVAMGVCTSSALEKGKGPGASSAVSLIVHFAVEKASDAEDVPAALHGAAREASRGEVRDVVYTASRVPSAFALVGEAALPSGAAAKGSLHRDVVHVIATIDGETDMESFKVDMAGTSAAVAATGASRSSEGGAGDGAGNGAGASNGRRKVRTGTGARVPGRGGGRSKGRGKGKGQSKGDNTAAFVSRSPEEEAKIVVAVNSDKKRVSSAARAAAEEALAAMAKRAGAEKGYLRSPDVVLISATAEPLGDAVAVAAPVTVESALAGIREEVTAFVPTIGAVHASLGPGPAACFGRASAPGGPAVAFPGELVATVCRFSAAVLFDNVPGFSPLAHSGNATKVDRGDPTVLLEIDGQPAARVISKWLFGVPDKSPAAIVDAAASRAPLAVTERLDEEGDSALSLFDIVAADRASGAVRLSGRVRVGAEVVLSMGDEASIPDASARSLRKTLLRDNLSGMHVVAAVDYAPAAIYAADARAGETSRALLLDAVSETVSGSAKTASVSPEIGAASFASGSSVASLAVGYPASVSTLSTGRLLFAIPDPALQSEPLLEELSCVHPGHGAVVYTDIKSSTAIWSWDSDVMSVALNAHDEIMRAMTLRFGGYVLATEGDAFMIFFRTLPDAFRFTMATQEALVDADWVEGLEKHDECAPAEDPETGAPVFRGLRVRMGLHLLTDEDVDFALESRTRRVRVYGRAIKMGGAITDTGDGGQTVLAADVAALLATPAMRKHLPAFHIGAAGVVPVRDLKVPIAYAVPERFRARTFAPLRLDRAESGHWTAVGKGVVMSRQTDLASARSARSAMSGKHSAKSRASNSNLSDASRDSQRGGEMVDRNANRPGFRVATRASTHANTVAAATECIAKLSSALGLSKSAAGSAAEKTEEAKKNRRRGAGQEEKQPREINAIMMWFSEDHDLELALSVIRKEAPHAAVIGGTIAQAVITQDGWSSPDGGTTVLGMFGISDPAGYYATVSAEVGDDPVKSGAELGQTVRRRILAGAAALEVSDPSSSALGGFEIEGRKAMYLMSPFGKEEDFLKGIERGLGKDHGVVISGGSTGVNDVSHGGNQVCGKKVLSGSCTALVAITSCHVRNSIDNGYMPGTQQGTVTRADGRVLYEIDHRPAAEVYNEWCGGKWDDVIAEGGGMILSKCGCFVLGRPCGTNEFGQAISIAIHPVTINEDRSMSTFAEVYEGETIRLLIATDFTRRNKMAVMARTSLRPLARSYIHGHMFAFCVSLPITQPRGMRPMGDAISRVLRHAPSLGGCCFGEQGQFDDGRLTHGNVTLSIMTFFDPEVTAGQALEEMREEDVPNGPGTVVGFIHLDDFDEIRAAAGNNAAEAASTIFLELTFLAIEEEGGYIVKSDGQSVMASFHDPDSAAAAITRAVGALETDKRLPDKALSAGRRARRARNALDRGGLSATAAFSMGSPVTRLNTITGKFDYFGTTVNTAARIRAAYAGSGCVHAPAEVLTSEIRGRSGYEITDDAEKTALRGLPDPILISTISLTRLAARIPKRSLIDVVDSPVI